MANTRILLVDDDKDFVRSAQTFLQARGYAVEIAHDAREAQAELEAHVPDLIVLDIMMRYDAEGFDWAFKLKNNEATQRIPIVIVSGFEKFLPSKYQSFASIQDHDWPAVQMFQKPVNLGELAKVIGEILEEAERLKPIFEAARSAG
jgi:DNA-binding response OmpR family regulator